MDIRTVTTIHTGRQVPRVLHVVGAMNVGGAETMLMNLYRHVDRERVQFDFLVFDQAEAAYDEEIRALGGRIIRTAAPHATGAFRSVESIRRAIRRSGPFAAVHAHVLHASSVALVAARLAEVPVRVAHSHNTADRADGRQRRTYHAASRLLIRFGATDLVACSTDAGRYLFRSRFTRSGKVIRNSVGVDAFLRVPEARRGTLRHELGLRPGSIVLGSVARMELVKNHAFLVDLTGLCVEAGLDVSLVLVGDGSLRGEVQSQVEDLGLTPRVIMLGVRRDIPELMAAFDAFLLPSLFEGLPVVLVEAQAAGLPSLVSSTVTDEIDLGLGLITPLSIDAPDAWVKSIAQIRRLRPTPMERQQALQQRGYDVRTAVDALYRLYEITS